MGLCQSDKLFRELHLPVLQCPEGPLLPPFAWQVGEPTPVVGGQIGMVYLWHTYALNRVMNAVRSLRGHKANCNIRTSVHDATVHAANGGGIMFSQR